MSKINEIGSIEVSIIAAIAIIAAVVATVSIIATMQYYDVLSTATPVTVITPKFTPRATPSPTIDETADWQTYKNEKYGFEFKYPQSFTFKESKQANSDNNIMLGFFDTKDGGTVGLNVENKKLDPENIVGLYGKIENKDIKTILIDGRQSYMYIGGDAGCGGYIVLVPNNNTIIKLSFSDCQMDVDKPLTGSTESFRVKILSTFKFTGTDATADWKTYTNTKYGFEFKYPQNFKLKENLFDSPGKDWDGSKINKLAIFDLFDNNNKGPIINPSLRLSISEAPFERILARYKEMERIGSGDTVYKGKQVNFETGTELDSHTIIKMFSFTFIFDRSLATQRESAEKLYNQILSTFKFTK